MHICNIKNKITLENLLSLYIILNPILDIVSFLFRNFFQTNFSPSTIIRPIIPIICFIILFFKENNKKKKIGIALIYFIYSITHLFIFQKLHNESSYGTIKNEAQYLINYSLMIINLYLFYRIIQNKEKAYTSVFISLIIYVASLYISIITKTSSSTYIEGIGYKGYFESGNSLCTVLILSLCIIFSNLKLKEWKKILLVIFTAMYLILFSGMRTGLFGFSIIITVYIAGKFFINIRDSKNLTPKQIGIISFLITVIMIVIFVLGSKTLERRRQLKQNEQNNIDISTNSKRYVTGDILNLYKQIEEGLTDEKYMSRDEQKAIIDLCNLAEKIKLSNVNLRAQQFIYNIFLVKEQKNIILILFGNGYKNQTGELVMEMEIPALICNFGLIGFILYFGPFLKIIVSSICIGVKDRKNINIEFVMYLTGALMAVCLSTLSGYVYFNLSSMTIAILCTLGTSSKESIYLKESVPKEQKEKL